MDDPRSTSPGSIMPEDLLALCPPSAKVVDTGPLTLDAIISEMADAHAAGLDVARLQGVAKVHKHVIERAEGGSDAAAVKLLEWSGEPEYTPRLKIQEVDEGEIVRSKAWARLTSRLAGVLCPECRARAAEAVGE